MFGIKLVFVMVKITKLEHKLESQTNVFLTLGRKSTEEELKALEDGRKF